MAIEKASHIYAVSPEMHEFLKREFKVESEVQLVATERHMADVRELAKSGAVLVLSSTQVRSLRRLRTT